MIILKDILLVKDKNNDNNSKNNVSCLFTYFSSIYRGSEILLEGRGAQLNPLVSKIYTAFDKNYSIDPSTISNLSTYFLKQKKFKLIFANICDPKIFISHSVMNNTLYNCLFNKYEATVCLDSVTKLQNLSVESKSIAIITFCHH